MIEDLIIDSPTFSGIHMDGIYPIHASFKQIEITSAGTNAIYFTSGLSGEATLSFVSVADYSAKESLRNYAPKLEFKLTFGEGNTGWQPAE